MALLPPGYEFYGGVQPMRLTDANGVPWQCCCAWNPERVFGFRMFKGNPPVEVPLDPFCTGGGTMNLAGWWNAARGKECLNGPIPGFAPVTGGRDARVDGVLTQLVAIELRLTAIETALGNIGAGGLNAIDTEALRRLKLFLEL